MFSMRSFAGSRWASLSHWDLVFHIGGAAVRRLWTLCHTVSTDGSPTLSARSQLRQRYLGLR
jgi:hypothetical protein